MYLADSKDSDVRECESNATWFGTDANITDDNLNSNQDLAEHCMSASTQDGLFGASM